MVAWNVNKLILVIGAALIVLAAVVNLVLVPDSLPFMLPFAPGILAAVALLVWPRRWLYLVAGILNALFPLVVVFLFGAYGAIENPGGGIETLQIAFWLVGGLLALLGGIMGFAQARSGQPRATFGSWQAVLTLVLVSMLAGYGVANAYATQSLKAMNERPVSYAESVDEHIRLVTGGTAFAPRNITMSVGKLTSLDIENHDDVLHTFSYQLADGVHQIPLHPHASTSVLLKFDTPQTIHVWCAPHSGGADDHSEESMVADIVVA